MSESKIVVGLDIGTTKICAIVARKSEHGKVEVLGLGKTESTGVQRGMVFNIEKTTNAIIEAVKRAEEDVKRNLQGVSVEIKINEVFVGIAGEHIKSQQNSGILMRDNEEDIISVEDIKQLLSQMRRIAVDRNHEIIDVLPQFYAVDNEHGIKEPKGMVGKRLEGNFHIITGEAAAAKNIRRCVQAAGLQTRTLILEPLASAAAVLDEDELNGGVCLVDIGGGTTDIAIFHEGIIRHTAIIPIAGNVITEDIKKGCLIVDGQAEALKTNYGSAFSNMIKENEYVSIKSLRDRPNREISLKNLSKMIEARVEEIIDQVYYEIKVSGMEKKLIGGIVLTGGGGMLKHLAQYVEFRTGIHARVGHPNEHLAKGFVDMASPLFATGIGLVLKGFADYDEEQAKNNLLTPLHEEEEMVVENDAPAKEKKTMMNRFGGMLSKWLRDGQEIEDFTEKS